MTATNGAGTLVPGTSQGVTFVKRAQSTSGSEGVEDIVVEEGVEPEIADTHVETAKIRNRGR